MDYVYNDEEGHPSSKVVRSGNKKFHIEHYNGMGWEKGKGGAPHLPYRVDELVAAPASKTVYVMEGERDVDKAWEQGLVATCNQGGAGKWTDADSQYLSGRNVVIVYDLDEPGARHAIKVHQSLMRYGVKSVRFKHAREGNDFTDHINEGYTVKQLVIEHPSKLYPDAEKETSSNGTEKKLDYGYLPGMLQLVLKSVENVTKEGGKEFQYNALCPAHDDHSPSLSISLGENGQIVLKCQAGCDFYKIADAMSINPQDLMRKQLASEHDALVEKRLGYLRADVDARGLLQTELVGNIEDIRHLTRSLDEKLAKPPEEATFLVDGLIRDRGRVLLNAQPKAGKTCLCLSLMKAVSDREESFLGRRVIVPEDGRCLWSNLDMNEDQSYEWLDGAGVRFPENFLVADADGYTVPIWEKSARDAHVELMRDEHVVLWVVDTLIAAAQGLITNENDNIEWYKFFNAVNAIRVGAGFPAVLFTHHVSRSDDLHPRGASSIEGWFDELWYMLYEDEESGRFSQDSPRILKVQGRDGHLDSLQLVYNPATKLYSYGGKPLAEQKRLARLEEFGARVADWYSSRGAWPAQGEARGLMRGVKGPFRDKWIDDAVTSGYVRRFRDGRATRYRV